MREWRDHWPLALVSALGMGLSVSHFYSLGLFMEPLETDFGWSRSLVSSGLIISAIVAVTCSPFVGAFIDRWGTRVFAISGIVVYCSSVAALGLVNASIWTWWFCWFFVAIGCLLIKPTVWTASVVSKFDKGRGLALAVTLSGYGLGSAIYPALTAYMIETYGWRGAYMGMSLIGIVLVLPLVTLYFTDSKSKKGEGGKDTAATQPLPGVDAREGLLSRRFVQLSLSAFLMTFALTATAVHLVPMLTAGGLTRGSAAAAAGSIGIATMVGRIATGILLDRLNAVRVGAAMFFLPVIPAAMLIGFDGSVWNAVAIGVLLGLSLGAEIDVITYLTTKFFGLRNFGFLFGSIAGLLALAVGVGSLAASMVFDYFGSYFWFNLLLLPIFGLCALMILTLGSYPNFKEQE